MSSSITQALFRSLWATKRSVFIAGFSLWSVLPWSPLTPWLRKAPCCPRNKASGTHACMAAHPSVDIRSKPSCLMGTNTNFTGAVHSQEMILRTGFWSWFISSEHMGAARMDPKLPGLSKICRQLLGFRKQQVRLKSVLLEDGERAPTELFFSDMGTRDSRKRVKRAVIHILIPSPGLLTRSEPLPGNWTFFCV